MLCDVKYVELLVIMGLYVLDSNIIFDSSRSGFVQKYLISTSYITHKIQDVFLASELIFEGSGSYGVHVLIFKLRRDLINFRVVKKVRLSWPLLLST